MIDSLEVPQLDLEQDEEQSMKYVHHKSCPNCGETVNITITNSPHIGKAYIESLERIENCIEGGTEFT